MLIGGYFAPLAILAASCIRNGVETFIISKSSISSTMLPNNSILDQYFDKNKDNQKNCSLPKVPLGKSKEEVISDLRSMKRNEIVTLFRYCEVPPNLESINGEWDGILLHNNFLMTSISNILTHRLFAKNHKWNGKEFRNMQGKLIGINRISIDGDKPIEKMHEFDYNISLSSFDQSKSIVLKYYNYQNILSPWKTMEDELRILRIPQGLKGKKDDEFILIGLGSMAWSGGILNSSPFCLFKS